VDEVGRGSWIGPVIAAAVCLPHPLPEALSEALAGLNDSKQLSALRREAISRALWQHATVAIGEASLADIEALNLHHASLLAAERAVAALRTQLPEAQAITCLMDGKYPLTDTTIQPHALIKGDTLSAVIAAASVVAKVWRDDLVTRWGEQYPDYGWARNKGYGTAHHRERILEHGPTPLHRPRFLRRLVKLSDSHTISRN
jgi:ribonuclease HII